MLGTTDALVRCLYWNSPEEWLRVRAGALFRQKCSAGRGKWARLKVEEVPVLRVLVGENEMRKGLEKACRPGGTASWFVPKDSVPGDEVVFLFNRHEFVARGEVQSVPSPDTHGRRSVHSASVGKLALLPTPVSIEEVEKQIPTWKWTTYPRSFTTPEPAVAERLLDILGCRAVTLDLSVEEGLGREARTFRYPRSARLRREALRVAHGSCEACKRNFAKTLNGRGACVLQVHHRHQRALDSMPRLTSAKDLSVLCANCHALVHMDPKVAMTVAALQKLLRNELQP